MNRGGLTGLPNPQSEGRGLEAWAASLTPRLSSASRRGGLRFVFYGRVSTEEHQDPVTSRARQFAQAEMLVAGHGRIVGEYFDVGQSRVLPWARRPQAAALLAAMADPDRDFEAIVVGEYERAFYGGQYSLMAPLFEHYGVQLWTPEAAGRVDFQAGHDEQLMLALGWQSKREITRTRIRVRAAMAAQTREQGRYLGGRPPFGYRLADAGPHPNKAHAAWGRRARRLEPDPLTVISRGRELPREEWEVLITGHHPGYLDWDTWQGIQARLRANFKPPRGDGGGAARQGAALLSGLVRCGKCGRMMQAGYSGHGPGLSPRYVCGRGTQLYGTPPCQSIGGAYLHRAVLGQLFQVLEPASLQATAQAMGDAEQRHRDQVAAFELALERARFEAGRAMRKLDEVEPGNRLVARTLEARLEERLAAAERAEAGLAAARARHPVHLTSEELAWLKRAGADIRAVFDAPATTNSQRKQLIRAVISEITLTIDRPAATCHALIAWQGTATSAVTFPLPKRGSGAITSSEDIVSLIRRLAGHYNDTTIARILSRQHRATATGLPWTRDRASSLRRCYGIPHCPEPPANVSGSEQDDLMATVPQAAQILGVDKTTIYRWLRDGFLTGEQLTPGAPWQIRITQALRGKIRPSVPAGWLPLDQAAKVLGVARQTVLHKVQRGELNAVHVTSGRRQGLRIQVEHDQPGLFATTP
jgi:DNA invertase Pin-like site-specific DNA recombinase/predicted DNA-binding transcriptional regulator AlpA